MLHQKLSFSGITLLEPIGLSSIVHLLALIMLLQLRCIIMMLLLAAILQLTISSRLSE